MEENVDNSSVSFRLTKYDSGSLRELWSIAWPLMLASLSGVVMTFVDRAVLARYHPRAFDACAAAQPWFWTVDGVLMSFVVCTEILVGRFNGARLYKKIGPAVWQMVVISFLTYMILVPVAMNAHYLLADNIEEFGLPYLQMLLMTLPFEIAAFGAIGAFFVGRGDTKKIPMVLLTANAINAILDVWFVFGGWGVPSMGIIGAALATNIASVCSFIIFLLLFLRKKYREKYAINSFGWSWNFLKECIHIGMPNATGCFLIMAGWSLVVQFFSLVLPLSLYKAYCVAFTIYNFMFFIMDGLGKGVGILCSNFIGTQQPWQIGNVLKQAWKLVAVFALFFLIFLMCSWPIVRFLADESFLKDPQFIHQVLLFFVWYWMLFVFETVEFCIRYFLFALLKTKITLFVSVVAYWGGCLLPTYFLISCYQVNPIILTQTAGLEKVLLILLFAFWYRMGTWKKVCPQKN